MVGVNSLRCFLNSLASHRTGPSLGCCLPERTLDGSLAVLDGDALDAAWVVERALGVFGGLVRAPRAVAHGVLLQERQVELRSSVETTSAELRACRRRRSQLGIRGLCRLCISRF